MSSSGASALPDTAARVDTHASTELCASGVGYVRAGRAILTDVTLTAYAGQAVAVTGPSGSGKSSLLALLAGLERPTTGVVTLAGTGVWPGGPALRQRYGLILQGYGLVSVLTAAENVELVLQARGLPAEQVVQRARAALDRVGMGEAAEHLVEDLSGGQQQRVAVARALVADPDVILADEPTAELDAGNRERILGLLLDEARRGRIVVLASHDREVADACDWEIRLEDGRLAAVGPTGSDFDAGPGDAELELPPGDIWSSPSDFEVPPPYLEPERHSADQPSADPLPERAAEPFIEPAVDEPPPPEPATAQPTSRAAAKAGATATAWRRPGGRAADPGPGDGAKPDADRPQEPAGSGWERPRG